MMRKILRLIVAVAIVIVPCSCVTKREIVEKPVVMERVVRDTLRETKVMRTTDTIVVRDSIAPNNLGGTDRWHSEYRGRNNNATDTVYINKTDSIPKPVYITTTKTKEVTDWQLVAIVGGLCFVLGGVGMIALRKK